MLFVAILGVGFGYLFTYAGIKGDNYVLTLNGQTVMDANGQPVGVWRRPWMVLVDMLTGGSGGYDVSPGGLPTSAGAAPPAATSATPPSKSGPGGPTGSYLGNALTGLDNWLKGIGASLGSQPVTVGGEAPASPGASYSVGGQTFVPFPSASSPSGYEWQPANFYPSPGTHITSGMGAY
jgi:hypothetical protein